MRCCRASIEFEAFVRVPAGAAGFRAEEDETFLPFAVCAAFPAGALFGFFLFKEFMVRLFVAALSVLGRLAGRRSARRPQHKQTRHPRKIPGLALTLSTTVTLCSWLTSAPSPPFVYNIMDKSMTAKLLIYEPCHHFFALEGEGPPTHGVNGSHRSNP